MKCPTCQRELQLLFTSSYCDWGVKVDDDFKVYRGKVIKASDLNVCFNYMKALIEQNTGNPIMLSFIFVDGEFFDIEKIKINLEDLLSAFEKQENELTASRIDALAREVERLRTALIKLRDCDWEISLPDRMDAVRAIAREALEDK